jgi:hypothetical protein
LVAAAGVVVLDVGVEHMVEVPAAGDENPVGALAADGGDPPLGDRVHPRCLRRGEHHVDADRGEHRIERGGELGVSVADQVSEAASGTVKIRGQVAGQLGYPGSSRVVGDAEQVDPAGAVLDHESRVQAFQGHGVDVKEVDRE